MSKATNTIVLMQQFFDYLLDLDSLRTDDSVKEYCKVIDLNETEYSAIINANKEAISLIKKKLSSLRLNYQLIEIAEYPEDRIGQYKILDIGI